MNLGIYLGIGESLKQMEKSGQRDRFIQLFLKKYASDFDKVYLFSYENESPYISSNVIVVPKKTSLHRYLYSLLIPIINAKEVNSCDVIRGFGLSSVMPALVTNKPFVFNWPYDYYQFLKIEKKYLLVPLYFLLEKIAFKKAKVVLVATNEKLKSLKGKKFVYLPNGVNLKKFRSKSNNGNGLVYIGRLERQKNLHFLLNAISELPKTRRSITFIGQGTQKWDLKKYAVAKKVSLTVMPPVSNLKLPEVLSKFSIFTLTSLAEGSPKILLEAMAMGLVPIVTNFATASEVIKNRYNGYIVNFDAKDYSRKLQVLIADTKLQRKMSTNARETIVKGYNLEWLMIKEIKLLKESAKKNDE